MENRIEMEYKSVQFKIKDIDDKGYFKGYASTFGTIPDFGGDIITKGAFSKTIANKGKFGTSIKMLWQHNMNLPPVGTWKSFKEDDYGLDVEGMYALKTQMGSELYELSKLDPPAIDSLSIGYTIVIGEKGEGKIKRVLKELALYEVSPVNFPMNPFANITGVKAMIEGARTERQLEEALRDAGLTGGAAKYIVGLCKESLADRNKSGAETVLEALRDARADIRAMYIRDELRATRKLLQNLK